MVSPKLSPIEIQRVLEATEEKDKMERSSEPIHDHVLYKAFAGKQVLFVALLEEAFEALWRAAVSLYKHPPKKAKDKKKRKT